jgi:hypothetical protein
MLVSRSVALFLGTLTILNSDHYATITLQWLAAFMTKFIISNDAGGMGGNTKADVYNGYTLLVDQIRPTGLPSELLLRMFTRFGRYVKRKTQMLLVETLLARLDRLFPSLPVHALL